MNQPFITVLILAFNEEKFLDICLSKIIDYSDKIIIVEGAVEFFWDQADKDGSSIDRTNSILMDWVNNNLHKIMIVRHGPAKWIDKHEMKEAGLKRVPKETDYLHIVDPDEIYNEQSLCIIEDTLETEEPDLLMFKMRHWGVGGKLLDINDYIHRIYKWKEGSHFLPKTINVLNTVISKDCKIVKLDQCLCDHYGHIDAKHSEVKRKFYEWRKNKWNSIQ